MAERRFEEPKVGRKVEKKSQELLARLRAYKGLDFNPPDGQFDEVYLKGLSELSKEDEVQEVNYKGEGLLKDLKFGS
jgi:hypothetical protein